MACCTTAFRKATTRHKENVSEGKKKTSNTSILRYCGATASIILVAAVWVSMADMTQDIERTYPKPFFLSFIAHSTYIIFIPIWGILIFMKNHCMTSTSTVTKSEANHNWKYYILLSIPIGGIGFLSSFLWNISLPLTSVSGNTAICQSSCAVVFIISVCFLKEVVTLLKILAVSLSVVGVFLISFCDSGGKITSNVVSVTAIVDAASISIRSASNPCFLGYLLCIASTVLFAFFEVFSKLWGTQPNNESPMSTSLQMTGTIGVISFIFGVPLIMLLHYTGLETIENPSRHMTELLLCLGILDAFFVFLLLLSINLATPLFASLGSMITLPASMLWDWFMHGYKLPTLGVVGVAFIGFGFILFFFADYHARKTIDYQPVTENSWKCEPSSEDSGTAGEVEVVVLNSSVGDKFKKINA